MIKNNEPMSMSEAVKYVKKTEDSGMDIIGFINKFIKLNSAKTKELRKRLEDLELMKVKTDHVVKIIDLMPEHAEDVNKIFTDISLDEDETKKILETVKQFK